MEYLNSFRIQRMKKFFVTAISALLCAFIFSCNSKPKEKTTNTSPSAKRDTLWIAPDSSSISLSDSADLILYGRNLIAHTSFYLGPNGSVAQITNGMNCQNCHLDAGTKPFGNNYSAVASTYPKFRVRSGTMETIEKRVNDCIERSLNGKAIDSTGHEMRAIVAYIKWLGKNVPKDSIPYGSGLVSVPFLNRAASPDSGKQVYQTKCATCHGINGQGLKDTTRVNYFIYPPLWGTASFTTAAGLFRLSRFAGYVKINMPFNAAEEQKLSIDEAWDVAAFVNSNPRPQKEFKQDWPDISQKPFDHPFGPYKDKFTEPQHKYGPFAEIAKK